MEQGNSSVSHGFILSSPNEENQMELPPGFRFHPTDEELITHYLTKKVIDSSFDPQAIAVVDINKCEPWDLPRRAKLGEKEWYFFSIRDRKYPTGLRTNRATDRGYWKATGKDKEIYREKNIVGMKKTLVFYIGRAPKGEKSNWVMHEFRLEGKFSPYNSPGASKNEWVISKIIIKNLNLNGKKASGATQTRTSPPLLEGHVTCFSSSMGGQNIQDSKILRLFNPPFQATPDISSIFLSNFEPNSDSFSCNGFMNMLQGEILSISQETGLTNDQNPEISSANEIGRSNYEEQMWDY